VSFKPCVVLVCVVGVQRVCHVCTNEERLAQRALDGALLTLRVNVTGCEQFEHVTHWVACLPDMFARHVDIFEGP
jgi:hypothetical protein